MNKIVIVGAGYAGVLTAKKLAKKFKKDNSVEITIIDKNPFHTMLTELHEVAAGRIEEESIRIDLKKIFAGRNVKVVLDTIESIDFENKKVLGQALSYDYDYLVLATGSRPAFFGVDGAEEFAYTLWSYEDAVELKEQIHQSFRKASVEKDPEEKRRLLSFYIIGAGFTGAEMTAELAEYIPILCEKYGIDRSFVKVCNADILPRIIPSLPEKLSTKLETRMEKMGVNFFHSSKVLAIGEDYIELEKDSKTHRLSVGTVIWTAGIESCELTGKASSCLTSTERGRIPVDAYLRSVEDENVYVIGDNMYYVAPGKNEPVPQMVENCEQSSQIAAKNIYTAIVKKGEMEVYQPKFHGVMVSAGGRYGVARVGTEKRMINLPSFFAMFVKHFINIVYFVQILGWNKVFSYMKHEFFTIRNKRSFVGGHFSNRTPSFLLVPLRIWLGCVWLFEGITKLVGGWIGTPKLTGFFGGANAWFQSILGGTVDISDSISGATDAVSAATDAVSTATAATDAVSAATDVISAATDVLSAATGAVADALSQTGTIIFNWNIFGIFRMIFVSGKDISQSAIGDFAFKFDIPLINLFIERIVLPNEPIQLFMQGFIVVAEILIGLALIGGLFTTPSSALSLLLLFMFASTTGLYLSSFWMIFAAIALLIGAGSIFGLDYYVVPALKNLWKRIPLVRRLYIYND